MGLLKKLRSHDRSKSQDAKPSDSQVLHSASSSGGSDFLILSALSQSSVDKKTSLDPKPNTLAQQRRRVLPSNRHSLPVVPSSPLRQDFSLSEMQAPQGQYQPSQNQQPMQHQHQHQHPVQPQQHQNQHIQQPIQNQQPFHKQGQPVQHQYHPAQQNQNGYAYGESFPYQQRYERSPEPSQVRPTARNHHTRLASGFNSLFEVSSADISGASAFSGSSSEFEEDETLQESHPYYKQWKEYYETLELQKMNPAAVVAQQTAQPSISPEFLSQAKNKKYLDNVVLNSRKSTLKSNRSASVPSLRQVLANPQSRAVSVTATGELISKSNSAEFHFDNSLRAESQLPVKPKREASPSTEKSRPSALPPKSALPLKSALPQATQQADDGPDNQPRRDVSQISDYAAYIFYDDDEEDVATKNNKKSPEVHRQSSTASASSYNSLQSEKQFSVGRHPSRIASPAPKTAQRKSTFNPPMPGPPPPIYPNAAFNGAQHLALSFHFGPPLQSFTDLHRQSTAGMPMNNAYMQMQHQIMLQQMQQMQLSNGMNGMQQQFPFNAPKPVGSNDPVVNARIQEFIALRQAITQGNKTLEFRLQWLKMLVCATNYKLYSYINIRGEPIPHEQISQNKQFFIRSTVNHLQKLLKELDTDRLQKKDKMFAEICFIQGCLYLQAYLERFYQDFGCERDDEEAERYLTLATEYDPQCFKAYYELGELYESQDLEDKFDLALENYKESAQLGYNRAIYKVALIYLIVPKVRLTKYFRYFKNLADIDMESQDIQLSGIDLEELEQVVGLAQLQLGKIYEGIYPGDLTIEDQFVVDSLELAPVNYAKSLSYYNRAAKMSCLQAQVKLGHIYEQGELNRPYNPVKSIQWYIKAATSPLKFKRHAEAMLGISRWFMKGTDSESKHIPFKDPQMAVQWCERACKEFGTAEALYQMGVYVEDGIAQGDAMLYFQDAAEMGHRPAQEKLEYAQ